MSSNLQPAQFRDTWGDPDPDKDPRFSYMKDPLYSRWNSSGKCASCDEEMPDPHVVIEPIEGTEEFKEHPEEGLHCENCAAGQLDWSGRPYVPPKPAKKTRKRR